MKETPLQITDILDAFPFYVMLVDEDHYILEANQAVFKYLGVKREDILGHYCPKVIHNLDKPFPGCPLEESVATNKALERELEDPQSGHWLSSAIYPTRITSSNGKKVFLHMVIDVTERKVAQEQLKISHEQLQSLSTHLETVREEEKKKIARDLHDQASQLLSSLHIYLEAAIETLPKDLKKAEELLRKAQGLSTNILDEIHNLIYELRPSMLDELGLVAAISYLIDNSLEVSKIKVKLRTTGQERRLSPPVEIALFRVVQETINNILKHAKARRVIITLNFKSKSLKIRVQDDGVGFDVPEVFNSRSKTRGLGLLGMRERMDSINGSLVINSGVGRGTQITVEAPYESPLDGSSAH
jgi:PAS domain S-box-containing protein